LVLKELIEFGGLGVGAQIIMGALIGCG